VKGGHVLVTVKDDKLTFEAQAEKPPASKSDTGAEKEPEYAR